MSGIAGIATVLRTDSSLLLAVTDSLLATGSLVRFRAGGSSMYPTIRDADQITVAPLSRALVRGDVVLCRQRRGPTAHRVVAAGPGAVVVLRGDNLPMCDGPVARGEVVGRVVLAHRGGRPRGVELNALRYRAGHALGILKTVSQKILAKLGDRPTPALA